MTGVALTAAILAAMAAVSSMLAGHHEHDAMMHQIAASDKWNEYQAKKIKTLVREERIENLESSEHENDPATKKTLANLRASVTTAEGEQKREQDLPKPPRRLEASSQLS